MDTDDHTFFIKEGSFSLSFFFFSLGIQCYTSDDLWLSRGAWKRYLSSSSSSGSQSRPVSNHIPGIAGGGWRDEEKLRRGAREEAEVLQPSNPLLIPFAPPLTEEEKHRQHQAYRIQDGHLLYLDQEDHLRLSSSSPSSSSFLQGYREVTAGEETGSRARRDLHGGLSLQPRNSLRREKKLPLHLWIFLGGKDMQALDGKRALGDHKERGETAKKDRRKVDVEILTASAEQPEREYNNNSRLL